MEIRLTCIGETKQAFIREGLQLYQNKLKYYTTFILDELPDPRLSSSISTAERMRREAGLFQKKIQPGFMLARLDERGKMPDSLAFSRQIEAWQIRGIRGVQFFVGGPYGFAPEFQVLVPESFSLSPLTMPHDLVRLVFIEQVYRAYTILRNEPYHHGFPG